MILKMIERKSVIFYATCTLIHFVSLYRELYIFNFLCSCLACVPQQSQAVDPETFSSQESNIILEQKAPVFTQQYASQTAMAQGNYSPMQDPGFHPMAQRPGYAALRMQSRPGLRPAGIVQNPPNQLRLQLQHRLQAQQVFHVFYAF